MTNNDPIRYIERSRKYYEAQGFEKPYQWHHEDTIPFTPLEKPLSESTVTIVTTTMPDASYHDENRRLYIGDLTQPPKSFYTDGLFWDRDATHTDDRESYFPINEINRRISAGEIGRLAKNFYSVPTIYSHGRTLDRDAPAVVKSCVENKVDIALMVPL